MRVVSVLSAAAAVFFKLSVITLLSSGVSAKTLVLQPDFDTTLSDADPYGSLAADSILSVQGGDGIKRSALHFDLSMLEQLDPAYIRSARLELSLRTASVEATRHVTVHAITEPWEESASWRCVNQQCSAYWDGGAFTQPSDTVKLSKHEAGEISFDVSKDMLRLPGALTTSGWLLKEKQEQPSKKHSKSPIHGDIQFGALESDKAPRLILELRDDAPDFMVPKLKFLLPAESFLLRADPLIVELAVDDDYPVETNQLLLLLNDEDVTDTCTFANRIMRCALTVSASGRYTIQAGYIDNAGHTATATHVFYLHNEDRASLGSVWHTGVDVPASSLGLDSDLYLNTLTAAVLQKKSGSWHEVANLRGPMGQKGADGQRGETGLKGDKGDTGERGEDGIQGERGDAGESGEPGIQGEKGDAGERGESGIQGEKGDVGSAGLPGRDAPMVDLNCVISQIAMFDGSRWVCRDWPTNPLSSLNCAEGDSLAFMQGAWKCQQALVVVPPVDDEDAEPTEPEPEPENGGLDQMLTLAVPLDQLAVKASNTYVLDNPAAAFDGLAFSDSDAIGTAIGTGLGLIGNRVNRSAWINGWSCSAPATNQWLDVHFDNPVILSRADIYNNANYLKYSAVSVVVEISTDHGVSYVEHARGTGSGLDQVIEILFDEPTPMITNVRFRIDGNTGALNAKNCVIHIDEIVLFGKESVVAS